MRVAVHRQDPDDLLPFLQHPGTRHADFPSTVLSPARHTTVALERCSGARKTKHQMATNILRKRVKFVVCLLADKSDMESVFTLSPETMPF